MNFVEDSKPKNDEESSGGKRKRMDARSYRALFRPNQNKDDALDNTRRKDGDDDCAVREPREEDSNNCMRELAGNEEEDGAGRLVSSLPSSVAIISKDVDEAGWGSSHTEVFSVPPDMKPSDTSNVVGEMLTDKTCFGVGVSPELEIVDSGSIRASTDFSGLNKSNQSIDSKNLDPICDVARVGPSFSEWDSPFVAERYDCFVGTCGRCSKRLRLKHDSKEQELCSCNGGKEFEANAMLLSTEKLGSCGELVGALSDLRKACQDKVCNVCSKDGNLLFCHGMGCGSCYHISCLDPPLGDVRPMVWHCIWCVKKKIGSGVHSVSKGVEEIWNSREVVTLDSKGKHIQKQYLVKYQGLAHVHNHWVSEIILQSEVSHLVDRFIQKQQEGLRWNLEWTVPHRLLKKRSIKFSEQQKSCSSCSDSITGGCQYEWLVKWHNLGYEHSTWELEDADFLQSCLVEKLAIEYELRRDKVKRAADKSSEGPYIQMTKLPSGGSIITDCFILNNVNKLREFWYKYQNAVVFNDQDRVISSIFFILSLVDIGHPFLVIVNCDALSHWETEFMRVAPSVDFVVYVGNEESRRNIRELEFSEEGGRVIPQVLLTSLEASLEDIHLLKDLRWGAILIDELDARVFTHLDQMIMLTTNSRVILFTSQLKDRVNDYLGVLSLLGCRDSFKGGGVECDNNISKLKAQLSRYMAYSCIGEPSKFVEYWVPAQLSNLQLEQYCVTLLSNYVYLRSCSKNDPVGAHREILSTIRKCCDHPYLVDPTLQGSIIKGIPLSDILDVGIQASGKLHLLDMILTEIKARQLRVLILFQPIVGSAVPLGDILEDFVSQRFGQNSYERVNTHVSRKRAALNRFNKKESGQFVFLLEKGACAPSIKLASVDTVVMFDSDWIPGNDLRALHKISIDTEFPQVKVFRLYSAYTIEEKVLILAKQNMHLDYNLQNISRSNIDTLLSWGVSNLFERLEKFHCSKSRTTISDIAGEELLANNVLLEFRVNLTEKSDLKNQENTLISKARQLKGVYCTNFPLLGESEIQSAVGEEPHIFWKNLLEGRNPCWRYPCSMTRNRKRVQYIDGSSKKQEIENDDLVKRRRRKVVVNGVNPSPGEELAAGEANESVPVHEDTCEELRNTEDPDTNATVIQSNGSDDGEDRVLGSDTLDLLGNQKVDANDTDPYLDRATLVAHPHEVIDLIDHAISAPLRQAYMDELLQCAISIEVQGEDQPNQDKLSQFVGSIDSENLAQLVTKHDLTAVAGGSSSVAADSGLMAEATYPTNFEQQQPSTDHMPLCPESGGQPFAVDNGSTQRINLAGLQAENQLRLSNSHSSLQADPLQIELEKLRKEIDQATKGQGNLKSQLRSECEKEIGEVVAEIRSKYEAKVQDAEAIFQLKKKALDTNVKNVFLNKVLADAVSTKCFDFRPSGVRRQQGVVQQLQHRSMQRTPGPANVGLSSAGSTPAAQQNTSLTSLAEPRSAALSVGASCRPPIISSISRPQTNAQVGVHIRAAAPHLQSAGSDFRGAAPHLHGFRADIRAAAPHLQPFRPPMSVPVPSRSSLSPNVTS